MKIKLLTDCILVKRGDGFLRLFQKNGMIALSFLLSQLSFGQQSITSLSTEVSQNFDGIGTSGTATLPTGFRVNTTANWNTGTTATTQVGGTSGTGVLTGTSSGGTYNFANGIAASATDRAVGFITSGSYSIPRYIIYAFTNNTGATVGSVTISYDYEKYRTGTNARDFNFYHGATATAVNTAVTNGNQAYAADGANAVVNPPTTVAKSFTITNLSIANGTTHYLAWAYTGSAAGNAQGLALDNFKITLNPAKTTPTISGTGSATNITYGQTLASSTISGFTASVPGTFAFTTPTTAPNAGTASYGVTFTPTDTANYNNATTTVSVTTVPATPTVTATGTTTYTYNGAAQGPASATNTGTGNSYTYSYSGTENGGVTYGSTATSPTNAGEYQMIATVAASGNYGSASSSPLAFTINKASSTISVTGDNSYAFNGSEHGPTTYDHTGSSGSVTFHYTGVGSTSYVESTTRPTAVGTYKAVATLATDNNYASAVSDDFNFQITSVPVPQITSPLTWSMTYGITATTYTVTASNNPTSFGVSGLPAGLSYNSTTHEITGTPAVAPGNYDVTLTATNEGGTGDEATLVITVEQKEVTISNPVVSDKVYDGNATASLTGTASGFVGGDDVDLVLTAHFDDANAGQDKPVTSTSTLTGTMAGYYTLTQPTGLTADIAKATPTVVVTGSNSYTFNGLAQGPATSTVAPSAAGTATYSYSGTENGGVIYGPTVTRPTNAGSYSVIANVAESSNYNTASSTAFAFTIAKADQALTGFGSDIVKLSTDAPFDLPTAVTTTGTQPVTYAITNTPDADVATISGNTVTITGVGATGITAHADETPNYNAYDASINLIVNFNTATIPTATVATNILGTGFNANWNAVANADSYKLDVYTKTAAATDTELFDNAGASVPSEWSATNVGQPGTYLKMIMNTSVLITPTIDLSNYATAELNMTLGTFGGAGAGNAVTFDFSTDDGATWSSPITRQGTSTTSIMDPAIDLSSYAGNSQVKIRMRTLSATGTTPNGTSGVGARLSNMVLTGRQQVKSPISGSLFTIPAQDPQPATYSRNFNDLDRDTQYYYIVRAVNNGNETEDSNEIAVKTTNAIVWDGASWSNANVGPDETLDAEIVGAYTSSTNFETNNLTITSTGSLTIQPQQDIIVHGSIVLPADDKITIENDGNLIQTADGIDTNPTNYSVIAKRNSTLPTVGYTFWSSPVSGQNLYNFSDGYNNAGGGLGAGTPWNRFYVYNEANDYFVTKITNEIELNSASAFVTGRGYAIRGMNKFGNENPATNEFLFGGKLNNGQLFSQQLKNSCTVEAGCEKGYNLVGNPYPSSIDFEALYAANSSKIYGTAYFWTNNDITVTQQAGNGYSGNNYAIYNLSGGTPAVDPDPTQGNGFEVPNGIIKLGQGFIVKSKVAGKDQSLEFNNDMRLGYDSNAVFYNSKKTDKNRFWLTFTSPANVGNTILVAYVPEATSGFEIDYDGELFVIGSDAFYSTLGSRKLAIQGRAEFSAEDKVALGNVYSKDGEYKISIKNKEGIFDGSQNIYLKDKVLNKVVNLSQGDYTFQGVKGTDETRFEIIYKEDAVLATDAAAKSDFVVYKDGNSYVVTSSKKLGKVELYDTAGRLMKALSTNETTVRIDASAFSNGVYILKVENSGDVKTKKVIK